MSSGSCLHHVEVFHLPVGSFLTMWMSSRHFLKLPTYCGCLQNVCLCRQGEVSHYVNVFPSPFKVSCLYRCLQCLIWKLPTSCRCLPIASRKFLTMWMFSKHFLKFPTYCVGIQNICLYRQGEVFSLCECLPITIWSFLLNVDVFNVSSVSSYIM